MKRKLILSVICLFATQLLCAQPYESIFGSNSTKWVFVWYNLPGWFHDTAYIQKDTIVNGVTYKKVVTTNQNLYKGGLLREDINTGQVWYRDITYDYPDDTIERVAFDFSVGVGDTFDISNTELHKNSYPDSLNIVDSVKIINGLKYIYFKGIYRNYGSDTGEHYTVIEGIGSNMGILWKHYSPTPMQKPYLLCSYKDGVKTSFENIEYDGICWKYSSINAIGNDKFHDISIYPQPTHKTLFIKNNTNYRINKVEVIGYTGITVKVVSHPLITNVDVSDIPAGYYMLKLYTSDGFLTIKPMVKC